MIVLDASVLIAYLNRDDAHSEQARWLLAEAAGKDTELVVNPVTLAEVLVAPTRVGRQDEVLRVMADVGVRVAQFPTDAPSVLARLRCTGLKMPDCCVLLTALEQRAALASFDERLRRAAADLDLRLVSGRPASSPES
ncbi:type II toxin-antitoxin system VapC family toxin [Nakamurella sp. GG22]